MNALASYDLKQDTYLLFLFLINFINKYLTREEKDNNVKMVIGSESSWHRRIVIMTILNAVFNSLFFHVLYN